MKDLKPLKPFVFPVGSGKGADKVLGDKALFTLGGSDGFRTRIVPLPTGGQLRVRTKNGMPEYIYEPARTTESVEPSVNLKVLATLTAKLADMYMTSGAYAFGVLGGINQTDPMLTVEPVTYKSSAVASVESSELVPLYDKTPPANGEVSKIYNHTVNPGGLNSPKAAMWNSRPSEFSGLMRRCMQGRYGSGNTSNNMVGSGLYGSVLVGSNFGRTTGILKFDARYFLVAVQSDMGTVSIEYWPLLFPADYAEFVSTDYSEAKEVLALSQAYVVAEMGVSLGSFSIPEGSPISYGWNFALTLNKATCVINERLAYGYDRRIYSRMELSFGYNAENDELSYSYSLLESVDGWITAGIAPIWSSAGGTTIWYNKNLSSITPDHPQDFPVYAFYADDILNVVRWSWSESTVEFNQEAWDELSRAAHWSDTIFGQGSCSASYGMDVGDLQTHGFYIPGVTTPFVSASDRRDNTAELNLAYETPPPSEPNTPYSIGYDTVSRFTVVFSPGSQTSFNPYVYPDGAFAPYDPKPGRHYYSTKTTYSVGDAQSTSKSSNRQHTTALVIPACDCSSVYIGHRITESGTKTITNTTGLRGVGRCDEWEMKLVTVSPPGVWPPVNKWQVRGVWYQPVMRQFSLYNYSGTTMLTGGVTDRETVPFSSESVAVSLFKAKSTIVAGSVDCEIFHPNYLYPYLSSEVSVVSSGLFGDARYNSGAIGSTQSDATSGYPTDISLFVGAA